MLDTLPAPSGTGAKGRSRGCRAVPRLQLEPRSSSMSIRRRHCLPLQTADGRRRDGRAGAVAESPRPPGVSRGDCYEARRRIGIEPAGEPLRSQQKPRRSPQMSRYLPRLDRQCRTGATPAAAPEPQGVPNHPSLESEPLATPLEQAEPKSKAPVPKSAAVKKPKAGKGEAKERGLRQDRQASSPKACRRPRQSRSRASVSPDLAGCGEEGLVPFKGSWSQLLGGPRRSSQPLAHGIGRMC